MPDAPIQIRESGDVRRFAIDVDGIEAELVYRFEPDRLILIHTGVPDALGGRGIGGRLVRAAIERARMADLTLVPLCPFALRWLRGHPDAAGGVTIDWPGRPPLERSGLG